jgi:hypothetical protein
MKLRTILESMLNTLRAELGDVPIIVMTTKKIHRTFKEEFAGASNKGACLFSYGPFPVIVLHSLEMSAEIILDGIGRGVHVVLMHDEMLDEGWV